MRASIPHDKQRRRARDLVLVHVCASVWMLFSSSLSVFFFCSYGAFHYSMRYFCVCVCMYMPSCPHKLSLIYFYCDYCINLLTHLSPCPSLVCGACSFLHRVYVQICIFLVSLHFLLASFIHFKLPLFRYPSAFLCFATSFIAEGTHTHTHPHIHTHTHAQVNPFVRVCNRNCAGKQFRVLVLRVLAFVCVCCFSIVACLSLWFFFYRCV